MTDPPQEAAGGIYHAADPILGPPKPWDELPEEARAAFRMMADAALGVLPTHIEQLRAECSGGALYRTDELDAVLALLGEASTTSAVGSDGERGVAAARPAPEAGWDSSAALSECL